MTERKPNQPRDWWRICMWPLLAASFAVAFYVSFTQQQQLGVDVGWDQPWGLPVILDLAYVATLIDYMRKPRLFNRVVSIGLVVVISFGNFLALLYDPATANLPAPLEIAGGWKVAPPLVMFLIAQYIANARKETDGAAVDKPADSGGSDTADAAGLRPDADRQQRTAAGPMDRDSAPDPSPSHVGAHPARSTVGAGTAKAKTRRSGNRGGRTPGLDVGTLADLIRADPRMTNPTRVVTTHHVGYNKARQALELAGRNGHVG